MDGRQMQILFTASAPAALSEVTDQAFGGRMYRSLGSEFAITFDSYFLQHHERAVIAGAAAEWCGIRMVGT